MSHNSRVAKFQELLAAAHNAVQALLDFQDSPDYYRLTEQAMPLDVPATESSLANLCLQYAGFGVIGAEEAAKIAKHPFSLDSAVTAAEDRMAAEQEGEIAPSV